MFLCVVALSLAASPAADAGTVLLAESLAPVVRAGWHLTQGDGSVTFTREAPLMLSVRGLHKRHETTFRLEVRVGGRLPPTARATLVARNDAVFAEREALERQMESFRGCEADSCSDFEPVTPAQKRLVARWENLNRRLVEVPSFYVADFQPVTLTVLNDTVPLRPDERFDCDDCDAVRAAVSARLTPYR